MPGLLLSAISSCGKRKRSLQDEFEVPAEKDVRKSDSGVVTENHLDKATDTSLLIDGLQPLVQSQSLVRALPPLLSTFEHHYQFNADFHSTYIRAICSRKESTLAPTNTAENASGTDSHTHYDNWHAWRMPGEDDHGQEEHAALYNYPESDSDSVLGAASFEDAEEAAETAVQPPRLEWDWEVDQADRARERKHDGVDQSFQVDRKVMRDVVKERMGADVARIRFISSGTFHKAYLVTLSTGEVLIARVARRFMPRLKVESEVATLAYLRTHTRIPVPVVYAWDSNPYNRLGGEWILMSRAPGVPLRKVYHSMPLEQLIGLLRNLAELLMPLFGHRFSHIGSLYFGTGSYKSEVSNPAHDVEFTSRDTDGTPTLASVKPLSMADILLGSQAPTPTLHSPISTASTFGSFTPRSVPVKHLSRSTLPPSLTRAPSATASRRPASRISHSPTPPIPDINQTKWHIGPIVSWPFFGSHRGELSHPAEIDRGPWCTARKYYAACAKREAAGVARENAGSAKPHKLHLDPDDVVRGKKGGKGEYVWGLGYVKRAGLFDDGEEEIADNDLTDNREEEDSDEEQGSPALSLCSDLDEDVMYRDYRRFQRSTFLVAELSRREIEVKNEMERWRLCMEALEGVLNEVETREGIGGHKAKDGVGGQELFGLDCHDLSLDNVFVDEGDPSQITCIIDWESTTTRPLWACAHLPSFLRSSPFGATLYRRIVASLPAHLYPYAHQWLSLEAAGAPLRAAHRAVEWDGWEEGLVDTILGALDVPDEGADVQNEPMHAVDIFPGMGALARVDGEEEPWRKEDWEEPFVSRMRAMFVDAPPESTAGADFSLPATSARIQGGKPLGNGATNVMAGTVVGGIRRASGGARDFEATGAGHEADLVRERTLDRFGDICGGRGGELGRRLEAWLIENSSDGPRLTVTGNSSRRNR